MYQKTIDSIQTEQTTRQHLTALNDIYINESTTDSVLKSKIQDVGIILKGILDSINKNKNIDARKADREKKFVLADSQHDSVIKLSTYCKSKL
ncbi:TPA: hypothetical protein I4D82_24075 [Enterobacter cloacae]|nr:hypothetical protein [Enterobacter cloacae]